MLVRNVYVYEGNGPARQLKNVLVRNGQPVTIFNNNESGLPSQIKGTTGIDAAGRYSIMPGLLDAHVHGHGGHDFSDVGRHPEALPIIMQALGETGLSYAMATIVSLSLPDLHQVLQVIDAYVQAQEILPRIGACKIVGVHLEGPFISKNCRGAHAEKVLQENINLPLFQQILAAAPHIKQWKITLAPDLDGAISFIREVKKLEEDGIFVKVFIGHTNPADKEVITKAVLAGAAGFTHLGNACGETCCRKTHKLQKDNATSRVVQWVLANKETCPNGVELIVDGAHLSQSFVTLVREAIGDKIVLVTDALGPSGCKDGLYQFASLAIRKDGQHFYLADENGDFLLKERALLDGTKEKIKSLAGSAATLAFCIRQYAKWLRPFLPTDEDKMRALYLATVTNPRMSSLSHSAIVALPDNKNFAMFDNEGRLILSFCNGQIGRHVA